MERIRVTVGTCAGAMGGIVEASQKYITDTDWMISVTLGALLGSFVSFLGTCIFSYLKNKIFDKK